MKKARWVIQNNLIAENDRSQLQNACKEMDIEVEEVIVIPFSSEIPKFTIDDKVNVYFGAISFINNVYEQYNHPVGVFFNENFTMENALGKWGEYMLNYGSKITTFKEFSVENNKDDELFFIRPDADDKSFAGEVWEFGQVKDWHKRIIISDTVNLTENTKILVGEAYNINKEWRNYIVDGKVVTSSLYRKHFKLNKSSQDIPSDMIKFVEDRCKEYQPHKIFVMDVATSGGDYYIIECGCINSVGLYACDIPKLVKEITYFVLYS